MKLFCDLWKDWNERRVRLAEFDCADPTEMARVATDLGTSVKELRDWSAAVQRQPIFWRAECTASTLTRAGSSRLSCVTFNVVVPIAAARRFARTNSKIAQKKLAGQNIVRTN